MKSLKKLAVIGAVMSTMSFAKAEEKVFAPTDYEGGAIEKIELVNGQLLVRSNGKLNGVEMPYSYVSTNTQHFAEDAFAQGGLTNVAQYVHAGNGKIYMTEKGNTNEVWTTEVGAPGSALNGVKKGVEPVNLTQDAVARSILGTANGNSNLVKVVGDDVYTVSDGAVLRNSQYQSYTPEYIPEMAGKRKDELAIVNGRGYVLAEGTVYSKMDPIVAENVDSISATEDGTKLLVSSEGQLKIFDPLKAVKQWTNVEGLNSGNTNGGEAIKSVVMSADGKMMYIATAKKLISKAMQ